MRIICISLMLLVTLQGKYVIWFMGLKCKFNHNFCSKLTSIIKSIHQTWYLFHQYAMGTILFIVMCLLISGRRPVLSCKIVVFVNILQVSFTQLLWKWKTKGMALYEWNKKKISTRFCAEERQRYFFSSFFHIEWLNFTLHWHIWGDAPWNQSNLGISEEQYFETSWDMWPYYSLHL